MKSLAFFLSMAVGLNAFAHDGGFHSTDPTREDAVLSEFVGDLKAGKIEGMKDLAIRVSSDSRIELRIAELILANTSTRVIHCLACREKTSDLKKIAKLSRIENFLDIDYEATKEHQELTLKISRASDQKQVFKKTYVYDEEESVNTHVEVVRPVRFTVFATSQLVPKEIIDSTAGFGLSTRADYREWGLEIEATRSLESFNSYRFLAVKLWKMKQRADELWIAAGASYLTRDALTTWGFVARAGYDWHFSRQFIAGLFLGDRTSTPYQGLEAGVRIGFIF